MDIGFGLDEEGVQNQATSQQTFRVWNYVLVCIRKLVNRMRIGKLVLT